MKNIYGLEVQHMIPKEERVDVCIAVVYKQMPGVTIFNLTVSLEKTDDQTMLHYERDALDKAASVISEISTDLSLAA